MPFSIIGDVITAPFQAIGLYYYHEFFTGDALLIIKNA
ncbi:Uncharacterised protein [Salmonella enterica subsp. enterica]|uniref:Uncharacterized protein n=1 Tax=Salmonella enterica I TaxID=59201 RepID=A0A379WJG8_SALET|nr:Uncharacterised protein [Salmonella enterica subsp. enterica]